MTMHVRKLDHNGNVKATYAGEVITRDAHSVTLHAVWTRPTAHLSYVTLEQGDIFREFFYADRWYNVFEISTPQGELKGWYADVTRPAHITEEQLDWEDLLLDIWMGRDGEMLILDEDEFAQFEHELTPLEAQVARQTLSVLREDLLTRWRAWINDQIAARLTARGWTLGTAESCTGGLIGDEITNRAGSSAYFMGGVISYDNRIKRDVLGVSSDTLTAHGAVSEQCALEMARGVRRTLGVDVGVSATGIAGPDRGGSNKPVGLTYIGVSTPQGETTQCDVWQHDRAGNKRATADAALKLLLEQLNR
jgi:nicotinamide-nucleotide amidase